MEDKIIKKIVKEGLYNKAPVGMMDRVMANLAVNPARRLSIKPVEPSPLIAIILPIVIMILLVLGVVLKPKEIFSFSLNIPIEIYINPIWIAPVLTVGFTVWAYILIMKRKTHHA